MRQAAKMIKSYEKAGNLLTENSYVDDIFVCLPTVEKVGKFIQEAEELLQGSFNTKHWVMPGGLELNSEVNILNVDEEKVLGIWDDVMPDHMYILWRSLFPRKFDLEDNISKMHKTIRFRWKSITDYFL